MGEVALELYRLSKLRPVDGANFPSSDPIGKASGERMGESLLATLPTVPEEVGEMVALLDVGKTKRYDRRSAELMDRARDEKRRRIAASRVANAATKSNLEEQSLMVILRESPHLKQIIMPHRRIPALPPHLESALHLKLACMPRVRSLEKARKSQAVSLDIVASAMQSVQGSWWAGLGNNLQVTTTSLVVREEKVVAPVARTFCLQWDSTSQRFRSLINKVATASGRQTRAPLGQEVMVAHGAMCSLLDVASPWRVETQPFISKSLVLDGHTTDYVIESVLRSLPFDVEDSVCMRGFLTSSTTFTISCTMDRASTNLLTMAWLSEVIEKLPLAITLWTQVCAAHGVALAKSRASTLKSITTCLCSFTRWTKFRKNTDILRDTCERFVSVQLDIRRSMPDETLQAENLAIMNKVFQGADREESALWRFDKRAQMRVKTQFLLDLESFCSVVDPSAGKFVHYCWVQAGSPDHQSGKAVGSACCSAREECARKVAKPLINLVVGRTWATAVESRWTNASAALRRFLLIDALGSNVLALSLKEIKTHWGLSDAMIPTLQRMIAADKGDLPARGKLRLLRFVQVLCQPDTRWRMAVCVITEVVADRLLWHVLGRDRQRATLSDLIHPLRSPIVEAQQALLELARSFEHTANGQLSIWALFGMVGGDFGNALHRLECRKALLQLTVAITDVFEISMSRPPYRVNWITYDDIPIAQKRAAAKTLFDECDDCLPLMCKRWKVLFPSPAALLERGAQTVACWSTGTYTSTDFVERAHSQMRHDMLSATSGADFMAACSRLFVRQAVSAHVQKGGVDPSSLSVVALANEGSPSKTHFVGGSRYLQFANFRRQSYKQFVAPDRALTAEERTKLDARIRQEWLENKTMRRRCWCGSKRMATSSSNIKHECSSEHQQQHWRCGKNP